MRRLFLGLAFVLGFAVAAQAGIAIIGGTDTGGSLGHGSSSGSLTVVLTTTVDVPPGNLIVAMPGARQSLTWTGCTDSAGNTYTLAFANTLVGTQTVRMFYSVNANDLPNGGTITCTANSASQEKSISAVAFSGQGASPLDSAGVAQTGSSQTFTVGPTGTLTYPGGASCEVLVGYINYLNNGTITESSGFTTLADISQLNTSRAALHAGYLIVSSNTPITYAPTNSGTSGNYAGNLGAFKGTGCGASGTGAGLPLVGVSY